MKRNNKAEIVILKHQKAILEIDLIKTKLGRDECRREMDKWRQAAQKLAELVLGQKCIPRGAKQIIKNFPNS